MRVSIDDLSSAITQLLGDYADLIYEATEEGLDAAEAVLINHLKAVSPRGKTGKYAKSWKGKKKKYRLRRYVGNTKAVKGKGGEIPLSNILEYGSKSPHRGMIKKAYDDCTNDMIFAIIAEIKKEA